MIRKFQLTEEAVEEEISQPSGYSGTVLSIGNFEKADANTYTLVKSAREIPNTVGNNSDYSGTKVLTQLFKKDTQQENYGANKVIALQMGERTRAKTTLDIEGTDLIVEASKGGVWGNKLKVTLDEGSNNDLLFILSDSDDKTLVSINNRPLNEIIAQINGTKQYITLKLDSEDDEVDLSNFIPILNQSLTGGTETTGSFTLENLQTVLNHINKNDFDILVFTEELNTGLYSFVKEYLDERYENGQFTIAVLPLPTSDSLSSKIDIVNTARGGRMYYINQTINDLSEIESTARIAGAIAGLPVYESLSEYILHDIDSIHPMIPETDIEELTSAGIICMELENDFSGNYKVYSSVSSEIGLNKDGVLKPESELHGVRSAYYCFNKLNEIASKFIAKTGVKKKKEVLKSELDLKCDDLAKEDVVESVEISLNIDPKNPKRLIMDREVSVFNIIEKIHNRDKIMWESN